MKNYTRKCFFFHINCFLEIKRTHTHTPLTDSTPPHLHTHLLHKSRTPHMSHTRQYIFIKDGHNSRHTHTHTVKQENPSWSLRSFRHPLNLQTLREPKSSALKSSRPQTNSTASNLIILHILPEASKLRKSQATRIIQLWWKATAFSRVTVEEGAVPLWLRAEFSLIC